MKVIYITSSFPHGPGEAFILPEVLELGRQGHEVWVVPMYSRGGIVHTDALQLGDRAIIQSLLAREIAISVVREFVRSPVRALRALVLLLTWKPRHLIKNLVVYPKGLWLAGLVRRLGVKHIHAHWAATTASMAMVAAEVSGIPWSFTAHRYDIVENNLLGRKCQHASFARFISQSGLELVQEQGVVCGEKARALHMGIMLPIPAVIEDPVSKSRDFLMILCVASLLPVKGHIYLIQALALLAQRGEKIHLFLAGDGELKPDLEEQVANLGLDGHVSFLGCVPHERLLKLYEKNEVDMCVLPSVDLGRGLHEGIPVSLIEAMAFEVPVIATETGGIPELLRDDAGLLVPPMDPEALAKAIARLVNDLDLRRTLGQNGRKRVEKEFAIDAVVQRLAEWFAEEEKR